MRPWPTWSWAERRKGVPDDEQKGRITRDFTRKFRPFEGEAKPQAPPRKTKTIVGDPGAIFVFRADGPER